MELGLQSVCQAQDEYRPGIHCEPTCWPALIGLTEIEGECQPHLWDTSLAGWHGLLNGNLWVWAERIESEITCRAQISGWVSDESNELSNPAWCRWRGRTDVSDLENSAVPCVHVHEGTLKVLIEKMWPLFGGKTPKQWVVLRKDRDRTSWVVRPRVG